MDGGILVRRMPPAHLAAGPRRPRNGPRRHVVQSAVKPVRADVDDPGAGDLLGKVPARDQSRQHFTLRRPRDLVRIEDAVEQHRALDAAVERDPSAVRLGRPDQDIRACRQRLPAVTRGRHSRLTARLAAHERLLPHRDRRCCGIPSHPHAGPRAIGQGYAGGSRRPTPSLPRSMRNALPSLATARPKPPTDLGERGQDGTILAGNARRADRGDDRQRSQPVEGIAEIGQRVGAGHERFAATHGAIARTVASTATVRMPGPAGLASAEITRTIDGGRPLRRCHSRHGSGWFLRGGQRGDQRNR